MSLIDRLHQAGIGVIFDWVPSHFPTDAFALAEFDGTHLFEHADPRLGFHPGLEEPHLQLRPPRGAQLPGLVGRALAVSRTTPTASGSTPSPPCSTSTTRARPGEWIPNRYGGRENLEAIDFLRQLNTGIYADHPDVQVIAEESTAFPGVSRPVDAGGLGFGLKWDMGWMHDTLAYMQRDPIHRRHHHGELTFRGVYAFSENFMLPLSHDEVVHGKGSLLTKMPGDDWQRFANLRLLYGYQFAPARARSCSSWGASWRQWTRVGPRGRPGLGACSTTRRTPGCCAGSRDLNRLYRADARAARARRRSRRASPGPSPTIPTPAC